MTFPGATSNATPYLCVTKGFRSHSRSSPQLCSPCCGAGPGACSLGLPTAPSASAPSPPALPNPQVLDCMTLANSGPELGPIPLPVVQGHINQERGQDQTIQFIASFWSRAVTALDLSPTPSRLLTDGRERSQPKATLNFPCEKAQGESSSRRTQRSSKHPLPEAAAINLKPQDITREQLKTDLYHFSRTSGHVFIYNHFGQRKIRSCFFLKDFLSLAKSWDGVLSL